MMPDVGASPANDMRAWLHQAEDADLDTKIMILSAIAVFIHAYLCMAVALLAAVYALANGEKRGKIAALPHILWMALFIALLFIVPPVHSNWLGLAAALAMFIIFVFYLYVKTVMTKGLFNAVADLCCLISLIYVLVALVQRLFGIETRSPSTFENANYYCYAMELVMLLSFYRLSTARTKAHKAFMLLVIASTIVALWSTNSRSAWPSVFCGLFVFFAASGMKKSLLALTGAAAVAATLFLAHPFIFPRFDTLKPDEGIRMDIWKQAFQAFGQHPLFGAGALGFHHVTGGPYPHAHDLLLEMLASFGLVGTFVLSVYFGMALLGMAKRFRTSPVRRIYALVFAAVAVTLVHGVVDVTVMWPQTGMLLALILAGGNVQAEEAKAAIPVMLPDLLIAKGIKS
jgi:O-antigen ligase